MLMAALIFVISLAAVVQFAVLSWRAALLKTAAAPLPAEWEPLAEPMAKSLVSNQFVNLTAYSTMSPDLGGGKAPKFRSLRLYYQFLQAVEAFRGLIGQKDASWTSREMALCTRCAAVMLSQHLERNLVLSAVARSF
jgi:hypothetical protein